VLKVIELFAGLGSQTQALKNLGISHEVVAISEIDRFALQSYEALHGKPNNLGDITGITRDLLRRYDERQLHGSLGGYPGKSRPCRPRRQILARNYSKLAQKGRNKNRSFLLSWGINA